MGKGKWEWGNKKSTDYIRTEKEEVGRFFCFVFVGGKV